MVEDGVVHFELRLEDRKLGLTLNSREHFTATVGASCRGLLALTRGAFLGELRLCSLEIDSDDAIPQEAVWSGLRIPFAPINGMDIPIVWTVNATRVGDAARVEVELSGGEKDAAGRPLVPPTTATTSRCWTAPICGSSPRAKPCELRLTDEALVLAIPRYQYFYSSIAHQDPPWPFRRTFYLRELEQASLLFAGYKAYGNRAVSKHLEATSPCETVYDAGKGALIHAGQALPPQSVTIELRSSADKQLCRDIPPTTCGYDRALASARANHYFVAGEDCVFQFELLSRIGAAREQLTIEYRVENAFFEPLTDYLQPAPGAQAETLAPGLERLRSAPLALGPKPPGVYHLRYRLRTGNEGLARGVPGLRGPRSEGERRHGRATAQVLLHEQRGQGAGYRLLRPLAARLRRCLALHLDLRGHHAALRAPRSASGNCSSSMGASGSSGSATG